jgi:hypothetical protein
MWRVNALVMHRLQQWEKDQKQELADMRKKRVELEKEDAAMREEHAKLRADTEAMARSQVDMRKEMADLKMQLDDMQGAYEGGAQALRDMKQGLHEYEEKAIAQRKAMEQIKADRLEAEAAVSEGASVCMRTHMVDQQHHGLLRKCSRH